MKRLGLVITTLLFIVLVVNLARGNDRDPCIDKMYEFVKELVQKFVDPKYQNMECLKYLFFTGKSNCDIKTIALPIDTPSCRYVREHADDYTKYEFDMSVEVEFTGIDNLLAAIDIDKDIDFYCDKLTSFKASQKSKQDYAKYYDSSIKIFPYLYNNTMINPLMVNFGKCLLDANAEALKFFQLSPPKYDWRNLF